eukprot:g19800.t1
MVKTRQGWVWLSPLELLAVEAMGGATSESVVSRAASAGGGVALAMGTAASAVAAAVTVGVSSVSVVLALEMEAVASVVMAFAVSEVVYPTEFSYCIIQKLHNGSFTVEYYCIFILP